MEEIDRSMCECIARVCCVGKVPPSTRSTITLAPTNGSECFGGLFQSYSQKFPEDLLGNHMSEREFEDAIETGIPVVVALWTNLDMFVR